MHHRNRQKKMVVRVVAAAMMERMGWVRGEVLGASVLGLASPLQPDLKHEHRRGLGYIN